MVVVKVLTISPLKIPQTSGIDYTGGGGGGANSANPDGGKKGGDGIVIVAYT